MNVSLNTVTKCAYSVLNWRCRRNTYLMCTRTTDYKNIRVNSRNADIARQELFESVFTKCSDVEMRRHTDITGGTAAIKMKKKKGRKFHTYIDIYKNHNYIYIYIY